MQLLKTYKSIFKVDNNKKNDVIYTFQNFPPRGNVGRNNRVNIITGQQGPQLKAQNTPSRRTTFEFYFTAVLYYIQTQKLKTLYQNCQIILSL